MSPTLLIMAAGIGSRYGGLKQMDGVGPNGEAILDYSIFDALRAGFGRVVCIIRPELQEAFEERFAGRWQHAVRIEYAFQELASGTGDFGVPEGRTKPWGTAHAILSARDVVSEPFAAINADDFYGAGAFAEVAKFLRDGDPQSMDFAMVGYRLSNTISDHGHVARGVCEYDSALHLRQIVERTHIERREGRIFYRDEAGRNVPLTGDEIVSMNFWAFQPSLFARLDDGFRRFLRERGADPKSEFFIPAVVDELIASEEATVSILATAESWFGVTYREDKAAVEASICGLIERGAYPHNLWGRS